MSDKLIDLLNQIDDITLELEEADESDDLERRFTLRIKLEELKMEHFRQKMIETGER